MYLIGLFYSVHYWRSFSLSGGEWAGVKIYDFRRSSGVTFVALIFGAIHLSRNQRMETSGNVYHYRGGEEREVEILIYANIL